MTFNVKAIVKTCVNNQPNDMKSSWEREDLYFHGLKKYKNGSGWIEFYETFDSEENEIRFGCLPYYETLKIKGVETVEEVYDNGFGPLPQSFDIYIMDDTGKTIDSIHICWEEVANGYLKSYEEMCKFTATEESPRIKDNYLPAWVIEYEKSCK